MTPLPRWMSYGRVFLCIPIAFLLPTVVSILSTGLGPTQLGVASSFLIWGAIWCWVWLRAVGRDHTAEVVGLTAQVVILSLFTLVEPAPIGTLMVFAFVVAGAIFPVRRAAWFFAGLLAVDGSLHVVRMADPSAIVNLLINDLIVGFVAVAGRALVRSVRDLAAAREEIARLAVTEERLRFSRDLHDLLGQSLAVVVLKSELVAKRLPADVDESLRQELKDVARVARKSLNDVREAVSPRSIAATGSSKRRFERSPTWRCSISRCLARTGSAPRQNCGRSCPPAESSSSPSSAGPATSGGGSMPESAGSC